MFSAEAARFCDRNHLRATLEGAVRLAAESFHPLDELKVELESDPETGEEYLVIDVVARGTLDSVLEQHQRYTERRVAQRRPGAST